MTKKHIFIPLLCSILTILTACAGGGDTGKSAASPEDKTELIIFAAASMNETLTQIAKEYQTIAPDINLTFNFDSSGALKTQIQEGADCDVFISAAQKQMNQLDEAGFILTDSRVNLLENRVVLVAPEGNPADITSFTDVEKADLMVLGNSDVPVGQYAEEIFTSLGLWDRLNTTQKLTFASNVKEVTAQVSEGSADCGVIYATDAASAIAAGSKLEIIAEAPANSHQPVVYPAAVLHISQHVEEAQAFLDFLQTDVCTDIFQSVGFSVPQS